MEGCVGVAAHTTYRMPNSYPLQLRPHTLTIRTTVAYTTCMPDPQFSLTQNLAQPDENRITYFALTDSRNKRVPFGIKREDRSRHSYVIGKTGMGKSTLLENMAIQDIQNGEGLCFIDPHGGTAEKLLDYVPEDRIKDVLYFAPHDMQYPISFNVLENVDVDKRHFVVAGLMSTFEKIWVDAWSARMAYILQNTLAALLEFPGATLLGVNRMYIDKEYRKNVIANITDPSVRSFWVDEYTKYTDRYTQEATPAIQNKIGQFQSNALVRNIIGQPQSAFDIRQLMDEKKILIVNLSKGRVGEGNANLLGSMLITKVYLAAMSRADASPGVLRDLPPFFLYVDEFQNFANRSFADILSEARKYKLALTIAHQYIEQMEEEVRAAVFGNVGTMMTFRVGAFDAEVLEKEFAPVFTADDLVNLGARQIYLKLMIDGISSQPFSAVTMPPIPEPEITNRDRVVAFSRAQFSRPRAEVEQDVSDWVGKKYEDPEADAKEAARVERRTARDAAESRPPRERMAPTSNGGAASRSYQRGPDERYPRAPTRPVTRVERMDTPHDTRSTQSPSRPQPVRAAPDRTASVRTGPARPPLTPRSAPPPRQPADALRNVLARVAPPPATATHRAEPATTQQPAAQATPASAPAPASVQPSASAPQPHVPSDARPPAPPRDDGKGVTEAGRAQLRDLLASLTTKDPKPVATPPPATPAPAAQTPPAPQPAPTPVPTPLAQPAPAPNVKAERPRPPRELPDEALKAMLHVEKPDLT